MFLEKCYNQLSQIMYTANEKEIIKTLDRLYNVNSAHQFSSNHKEELLRDSLCGCFYCLEIFSSNKITEWIGSNNDTAICPYCKIDSIIGESSGYPITKEFLAEMKQYRF